jgi:hypothetical protein
VNGASNISLLEDGEPRSEQAYGVFTSFGRAGRRTSHRRCCRRTSRGLRQREQYYLASKGEPESCRDSTHPDQWARQRTERAQRRWWHPTRRGRHPQRYPQQRRFRRQGQRPSRRCRPRPDRGLGRRRDRGEPTSCLGRWCLGDGGPLGREGTRSVTPRSSCQI